MSASAAYVNWYEEETGGSGPSSDPGAPAPQRVKAAWLVHDVTGMFGERREVLAYLGRRPAVTVALQEEVAALYPEVRFDWAAIRRAIAAAEGYTNAAALTDDELTLRLRPLARERGMSLMDLSLRLGYRQRQVLPEVTALLADPSRVARYERTSGSVFDYMIEKHPEYAYLIYKARLFFEGDDERLAADIAAEPKGYDDAAWRARRQFWKERLEAYCRARRAPERET